MKNLMSDLIFVGVVCLVIDQRSTPFFPVYSSLSGCGVMIMTCYLICVLFFLLLSRPWKNFVEGTNAFVCYVIVDKLMIANRGH